MEGYQKLIGKLKSEATAKSEAAVRDARLKAAELVHSAKNKAKEDLAGAKAMATKNTADTVARRMTVAEMDGKKMISAVKAEIVDDVFVAAKKSLLNLPDAEYRELVRAMIAKNAEDGDEVMLSKADKKRLPSTFIDEIAKETGLKIKLSKEYGDFDGGVILRGKNADKNMTFEVELSEFREEHESEIGRRLFACD